jgi:serine O-acetyltransferase
MLAIKLYRAAHWFWMKHVPALPHMLTRLIYILCNCHIHYETTIGRGTTLAYGGIGVVIHKRAVIGQNCVIESNVTIGGRNNIPELPVIGDGVFIGTGARILGNVHIGCESIIGANAVVVKDVPDRCTVAGIPAKVLHMNVNIAEKCNIKEMTIIGKVRRDNR